MLPVYKTDTGFNLTGQGQVIDHCLQLARFDQADLLDNRLASESFDPAWMDALAGHVADFHLAEQPVAAAQVDHAALLSEHIDANLMVAADHPEAIDAETLERLRRYAAASAGRLGTLLADRQQQGHVRRCHGDLHLRNIVLIDGEPRPFDRIEFNDQFAIIDTMNDAAFLVMDCDARGRPDLAMRFISRYLERSGDYAGVALPPHYCCYRAGVRGKVACLLADELEGTEKAQQLAEARHYFTLAADYCTATQPKMIAIGGLSGSGKSHLALQACGIEHAIIIRSDATHLRLAAAHPELKRYGEEMNRLTYTAMCEATTATIRADFTTILDATFLQSWQREQIHVLAESLGSELHCYWLEMEPGSLKNRIEARSRGGHDISEADLAVLELQLRHYQRPAEPWITFIESSETWPPQSGEPQTV